ncbi:MAG: hypothetical protein O3A96_14475 [Proteobacteria bacterium]|nr:hypothetical protein [Pseudomonadota bacterium]
MTLLNTHFVDEALRLVREAEESGIQLRILGSVAYRLHSPSHLHLFDEMARALTDVDFAAERRQSSAIRDFMVGQGYEANDGMIVGTEGARHVYLHSETNLNVDVFTDELFFCHRIPFKGRLDLDYPTITTTDLLLEKMQIVEINLKDIKDTLVLLLEHPISEPEAGRESIDGAYITGIMSKDWGFYYTFTTNIQKVVDFIPEFPSLNRDQADIIKGRVHEIVREIESAPKSLKWKIRAKIGTRQRWYQEVSDKGEVF